MRSRGTRKAAVAFAIAVVLIGGSLGALVASAPARAASAVHIDTSGALSVTAEAGFAFDPNNFEQLPTNSTITVTFTDNDVQDHTFTIIDRQGWVIPNSYTSEQIDALAFSATSPALFNANATASTGSTPQVIGTFTSPGVGWYEFVCTEPGHFQSGMYGYIAFGENLPANLTVVTPDTDPGAAVFIIVGTIVSLVVIALVLGFVVGRRRGSTYEMAPQRLGYAEPDEPKLAAEPPLPDEPRG
jgi:plastocyanin